MANRTVSRPPRLSPRLTLRQLEYFVAAGEAGSIKLASATINVSQPSISTAISDLEATLGVTLFIRHHAQGVALTTEGRRLMAEARSLLQQAAGLHQIANELATEMRGLMTVGALVTIAPVVLPSLVRSFQAEYPKATISPAEVHQESLRDRLRQGEIDIALTYDLDLPADIAFEPIAKLPPYAYVADGHKLARRAKVRLEELAGDGLVLLDLPLTREYFLSHFINAGLTPRIAFRSSYPEVVRGMVANGLGYGLANLPLQTDRSLDGKRFRVLELAGNYRPMVLGLARRKDASSRRIVEAFAAHAKAALGAMG
ncbi:MAG: LysR substrate-binding domain-containing protein [Hyphomicrobiaceae bacterium]